MTKRYSLKKFNSHEEYMEFLHSESETVFEGNGTYVQYTFTFNGNTYDDVVYDNYMDENGYYHYYSDEYGNLCSKTLFEVNQTYEHQTIYDFSWETRETTPLSSDAMITSEIKNITFAINNAELDSSYTDDFGETWYEYEYITKDDHYFYYDFNVNPDHDGRYENIKVWMIIDENTQVGTICNVDMVVSTREGYKQPHVSFCKDEGCVQYNIDGKFVWVLYDTNYEGSLNIYDSDMNLIGSIASNDKGKVILKDGQVFYMNAYSCRMSEPEAADTDIFGEWDQEKEIYKYVFDGRFVAIAVYSYEE